MADLPDEGELRTGAELVDATSLPIHHGASSLDGLSYLAAPARDNDTTTYGVQFCIVVHTVHGRLIRELAL